MFLIYSVIQLRHIILVQIFECCHIFERGGFLLQLPKLVSQLLVLVPIPFWNS
jgi:hypothetical protein